MRKNTVKKILAALLALGAISALTACSNSQTTAQSTAESSKSVSESSTESSQESSAESSIESSVESSKAVSESSVESSKESSTESSSESSVESSKNSVESSKETSKETSNKESKASTSEEVSDTSKVENTTSNSSTKPADDILKSFKSKYVDRNTITAYGKCVKSTKLIGTSIYDGVEVPKDARFGIIKAYDGYYEVFINYSNALIDSSCIELFPDNYVPDESDPYWVSLKHLEDCIE
ncbi:hypothetical protein DW115_00155 [Clostridium sp. AM09-51]|nr:hypothetical protein DW115_00155 [Clostridium sp. AM09-51]